MNVQIILLSVVLATPVWAGNIMKDCKPGSKRKSMQCISRNGVCVDVSIDGHQSLPISKTDRKRMMKLPDMDGVCWQIKLPVSAEFRIKAQNGGLRSDFIGALKSLSVLVVPIGDYDPEYDGNRIDPLHGLTLQADGYRNGTWQLREQAYFRTSTSGGLTAGEYVIILRIYGEDNWDRQKILLSIDPEISPIPAQQGTK